MIRFRKVKLGVFRQYQNTKTTLRKKNIIKNCFKKCLKLRRFN